MAQLHSPTKQWEKGPKILIEQDNDTDIGARVSYILLCPQPHPEKKKKAVLGWDKVVFILIGQD